VNILVLGSGAREHALAARLSQEPGVARLVCAPGNAGMAAIGPVAGVSLSDADDMLALAEREGVTLTIVGPELPLSVGVVDRFVEAGRPILGPSRAAARIETSKVWAKQFMARHHVPTARFLVAETAEVAFEALSSERFGWPLVIKADGLAAGKGVVLVNTTGDAMAIIDEMLTGSRFGEAGRRIVLEECLVGPEVSFFVLSDGRHAMPIGSAQDHKRALDGDRGPNTGGMGAYTPLPWAPDGLVAEVLRDVLQPTVDELARRGTPFRGLLYAGLALTSRGVRVVEFNARFGDPETQPLLALLDSPLSPLLVGAATGTLHDVPAPVWRDGAAVTVVMASRGYPGSQSLGDVIVGCETLDHEEDVHVIHAGTARDAEGHLVTAGGRVLAVTAVGRDIADARAKAYEGVASISFPGAQWRHDIAASPLVEEGRLAARHETR
jgi:phosphoribosylamine---glycine ligase